MENTKKPFGYLDTNDKDDIKVMEQMLKEKRDVNKSTDKHSDTDFKVASA